MAISNDKNDTKNQLKTVWYQKIYDKHYKKYKDHYSRLEFFAFSLLIINNLDLIDY